LTPDIFRMNVVDQDSCRNRIWSV